MVISEKNNHDLIRLTWTPANSDVKRGQIFEAEAKAEDHFLSPLITYKKSPIACKP